MAANPYDGENRSISRAIVGSEAEIKAFVARLDKFYGKNLSKILKGLKTGKENAREAAQVLGNLQSALKELGLDSELGALKEIYGKQLKFISEEFANQGANNIFSGTDRQTIETLITFDTSKIASRLEAYTDDIKSRLMRSVLLGEPLAPEALHSDIGETVSRQLEAETNTLLGTFSRTVTEAKAEEIGFDLRIYYGPVDKRTRDFCRECMAGQLPGMQRNTPVYTTEEIDSMDNGNDLGNVLINGGGWNCRHHWQPVSLERAREVYGYAG